MNKFRIVIESGVELNKNNRMLTRAVGIHVSGLNDENTAKVQQAIENGTFLQKGEDDKTTIDLIGDAIFAFTRRAYSMEDDGDVFKLIDSQVKTYEKNMDKDEYRVSIFALDINFDNNKSSNVLRMPDVISNAINYYEYDFSDYGSDECSNVEEFKEAVKEAGRELIRTVIKICKEN